MENEIVDDLVDVIVEDQVSDTSTDVDDTDEVVEDEVANKQDEKSKVQKRINDLIREKNDYKRQLEAAKNVAPVEGTTYSADVIASLVQEQAAIIAEQNSFNDKCNAIFEAGVAKYADFGNNVKTLNDMGMSSNKEMFDAIVDSDNASDILQYLAENLDETEKFLTYTPSKLIRELTKLDVNFTSSPATAKAKPVSKAPAPIKPVSGKGGVVAINPESDAKAWIAKRNADKRRG